MRIHNGPTFQVKVSNAEESNSLHRASMDSLVKLGGLEYAEGRACSFHVFNGRCLENWEI